MSTITINLDNLSKEEQETVKRLANKKKRPYFVPEDDEVYWYINEEGNAVDTKNDEVESDKFFVSIGNCTLLTGIVSIKKSATAITLYG